MVYRSLVRPILFRLPPETAHELALHSLSLIPSGLIAKRVEYPELHIERFGLSFPNPVGLAAGFDKNGVALRPLAALGVREKIRARASARRSRSQHRKEQGHAARRGDRGLSGELRAFLRRCGLHRR